MILGIPPPYEANPPPNVEVDVANECKNFFTVHVMLAKHYNDELVFSIYSWQDTKYHLT